MGLPRYEVMKHSILTHGATGFELALLGECERLRGEAASLRLEEAEQALRRLDQSIGPAIARLNERAAAGAGTVDQMDVLALALVAGVARAHLEWARRWLGDE